MKNSLITHKVPDEFKRRLVSCVNKALQDDLPQYLAEFQPDTKNAVPHLIGDWINKNIRTDLASDRVDIKEFTRHSWKGKVIIDRINRMTYTIMREKRLLQVRKEKRDRPHYLQTIVTILNKEFKAPLKQMKFFGEGDYRFDQETLEGDYDSIFSGCLGRDEGFIYCAVVYNTFRGGLYDIKLLFLDKDLDVIEELPLNDYIKPDFAALTSTLHVVEKTEAPESKASARLISLKKRVSAEQDSEDTAASPASLRENEKQA